LKILRDDTFYRLEEPILEILYGDSFKVFPLDARYVQERYLPKLSTTSDVRYCLLKPIVRRSAGAA